MSTIIFRSFGCQNVDPDDADSLSDNYYLRSDYSISCNSDRYAYGVAWASVMLVVYPLGVPLLYLYLLYNAREVISQRRDVGMNWGGASQSVACKSGSSSVSDAEGGSGSSRQEILIPLTFLYAYYLPEYWYWEVCFNCLYPPCSYCSLYCCRW